MEQVSRTLFVRLICVCSLLPVNTIYCDENDGPCSDRMFIRVNTKKTLLMGTRGAWAADFLRGLGNSNPSEDTIKLVAAWTRVENTRAAWNPLATTLKHGSYTDFNSVGVKNYSTRQEGIDATVITLAGNHAGYERLKQGLLTNDPQVAIFSGGFDTWGSHSNKVAASYYAADFRGEPLKSEESGSVSGGTWGDPNIPTEPRAERSLPENERPQTTVFGTVTEQDIRNIAKMFLGITLIAIGGLVFVVAIIKTDAAQQALTTAAKVAV